MSICKKCKHRFNIHNNIPYILKCGHTYCMACIDRSFGLLHKFQCRECYFVCSNKDELIINRIAYESDINRPAIQRRYSMPDGVINNKGMIEEGKAGNKNKCLMKLCTSKIENGLYCFKCLKGLKNTKSRDPRRVKRIKHIKQPFVLINSVNMKNQSKISDFWRNPSKRNENKSSIVKRIKKVIKTKGGRKKCLNPECYNLSYKSEKRSFDFCGLRCQKLMLN